VIYFASRPLRCIWVLYSQWPRHDFQLSFLKHESRADLTPFIFIRLEDSLFIYFFLGGDKPRRYVLDRDSPVGAAVPSIAG